MWISNILIQHNYNTQANKFLYYLKIELRVTIFSIHGWIVICLYSYKKYLISLSTVITGRLKVYKPKENMLLRSKKFDTVLLSKVKVKYFSYIQYSILNK